VPYCPHCVSQTPTQTLIPIFCSTTTRDPDTALPTVLGQAIWHAREGATAYLIVSATGAWRVEGVPVGRDGTACAEQGQVVVPIPVAPGAITLADEDMIGLSPEGLYRHCVGTKAAAETLERELAARFYRALYGQEGGRGE